MAIAESSSTNDQSSASQTSSTQINNKAEENKSDQNDIDINLNLTENSDDSWLKEEDEKNKVENVGELKTENLPADRQGDGELENKKIEDFDIQKTNLKSDMEIIQGLQNNTEKMTEQSEGTLQGRAEEKSEKADENKMTEKSLQDTQEITETKKDEIIIPKETENKSSTINLDNFLGQIKNTNQTTNETNNNVVTNNEIQNYNKQNTNPPAKKGSPNKTLIFMLMLLILIGLGFFIIKTMFPVELQNLFGTGKTNIENLTGDVLSDNELSGNNLTGDVLSDNELSGNNLTGDNISSGDIHNSADLSGINNQNTFQDIDEIIDNTDPLTSLSQLKDFSDKGNKFWTLGKTTNDKLLIKYGLYIRKKSSQLIERLESGENIDKQELDKYIGQFSGYLEKLNNLNTIPTTENEISQNLSKPTGGQTTDRQQSGTDEQIQSEQIDQIQNLPQTQ